jgi:hypothetical protein
MSMDRQLPLLPLSEESVGLLFHLSVGVRIEEMSYLWIFCALRSIGLIVDDATSVSLWKANSSSDELCGGVCSYPIVKLLRSQDGDGWSREQKNTYGLSSRMDSGHKLV